MTHRLRVQPVLLVLGLLLVPFRAMAQQPDVPCQPNPCFGMPFTGSPFPASAQHDGSANARDNLVPRTVVITEDTSLTYEVNGRHWPAVYRPGIDAQDINDTRVLDPAHCPTAGGARVQDPTGRLFETTNCVNNTNVTIPASVFSTPGRYLVICQIHPHFEDGMWGWVEVKAS